MPMVPGPNRILVQKIKGGGKIIIPVWSAAGKGKAQRDSIEKACVVHGGQGTIKPGTIVYFPFMALDAISYSGPGSVDGIIAVLDVEAILCMEEPEGLIIPDPGMSDILRGETYLQGPGGPVQKVE